MTTATMADNPDPPAEKLKTILEDCVEEETLFKAGISKINAELEDLVSKDLDRMKDARSETEVLLKVGYSCLRLITGFSSLLTIVFFRMFLPRK